jgi:D-amino peptidase
MRVFIIADIEGAVGISNRRQCYFIKPEFEYGRDCLTKDINAVIEGVLAGGADVVAVRDTHETGQNILKEALHPRAEYLGGQYAEPFPILGDPKGSDLAFMVASHAMSGNQEGFFAHTFLGAFTEVRVNDIPVGEAFIYGASLAEVDIPIAFNSGDVHAINESLQIMPWMKTVVVPKDEAFYTAPDADVRISALRDQFRTKALEAVREHHTMRSMKQPPEPKWEVDIRTAELAGKINAQGLDLAGHTLSWRSRTYIEGFRTLFGLVHAAFAAL